MTEVAVRRVTARVYSALKTWGGFSAVRARPWRTPLLLLALPVFFGLGHCRGASLGLELAREALFTAEICTIAIQEARFGAATTRGVIDGLNERKRGVR
jgi:hypothetical protein